MTILPQLILIVILILLNGFFVASEFALISSRKTRIAELAKKGNKTAKRVQHAQKQIGTFISATQLGITLASLAIGWLGEPLLADFFMTRLSFLPSQLILFSSHTLSFAAAFIIITFFHIVLGELVPKNLALQKGETVSLFIIHPLSLFTSVFKPFIWILNKTGRLVLMILGLPASTETQGIHSEEEIRMLLTQSGKEGAIPLDEVEMVQNVFKIGDISVKQVMIPRTDVVAFSVATPIGDIIEKVSNNTYSRFPIYERSIDRIIGFVHIKDIYKEALNKGSSKRLSQTNLIREILFVPEAKKADEVLLDMRKKGIHLAVVNDEYGGTSGVVTLEDILESLVGEIQDEFDKPLSDIVKNKDGSYIVDGLVSLDRIETKFHLPIKGQGYATIGGLLFGLLGRDPKVGDIVELGNTTFTIESLDRKRIRTIQISKTSQKKS